MSHTIFVYGSLKQGFHNHSLIEHSRFLGRATTSQPCVLLPGPGFPFLVKQWKTAPQLLVEGELYEVDDDTFAAVDLLEGNGSFYQRQSCLVVSERGPCQSWIYFLMDPETYLSDTTSAASLVTESGLYCWTQACSSPKYG